MIRSGIVLIDELCGGLRPRSSYLLTGGAGAGKTSAALQFVGQALDRGEIAVMLTHASRTELLGHANSLGIQLSDALRADRVVVLRYRPDFLRRVAQAGTTERVLEEIRGLLARYRPRRLVIDTFAPFLDDASPSPLPAAALVELVERCQATVLLTYPDDLAERYDRRIEPIVQHAAGIFRLGRDTDGRRRAHLISLREHRSPLANAAAHFPGPEASAPNESLVDALTPILLVRVVEPGSDDLLSALRLQHDVAVKESEATGALPDNAALVLETDHTALDRTRALVRASTERRRPIVVVSRFNLRSIDRARLLRDGADEVLAGDMGVPELLQRLATALRRGHLVRPPVAVHEDESLTQRTIVPSGELLDRDRFASALQTRSAHDDAVPFTVLRLTTPERGAAGRTLGTLVLGTMRLASGDLAALVDDAIVVYLHGAARRDAAPFLERVRARRAVGSAPLRVEMASFPADGAAVRQLLEPLEVR